MRILAFLLIVSSSTFLFGQEEQEVIVEFPNTIAEFPGGQKEMQTFISEHINYPTVALENSIQGKVYVQFVVFKDGSIGRITILRSVHPVLDGEAERVVKSMPNWKPAEHAGATVNSYCTVPINFKMMD